MTNHPDLLNCSNSSRRFPGSLTDISTWNCYNHSTYSCIREAHPITGDDARSDLNLWISRRTDNGWSIAEPLIEDIAGRQVSFFSRRKSNPPDCGWPNVIEGNVYWVNIDIVHRLKANKK